MNSQEYFKFLETKKVRVDDTGISPVTPHSPLLFPFQRDVVRWALRRGRAAIFADTGLGKTASQLAWADQVCQSTGGAVIILAPLAVGAQTQREGVKFRIETNVCRSQSDVEPGMINITNYERLHLFDASYFKGVVLDESSILKAFASKTKQLLVESFKSTPFRLCCTATPAPNDHLEIGNHAEMLGIMPSNEMIARWFINDTMSFGTYRLKGHAVESFWNWVSSWAVCFGKPSDLGNYDDTGYILPPLIEELHFVDVDILENNDEGSLLRNVDLSATGLHREMRLTAHARALETARIVASKPDKSWLVWCNTNYEADEIKRVIPEAVEVRGSDKPEVKEDRLIRFANGEIKILLTKPEIAGFGMNFQVCHNMVFTGLSYSYEKKYQAVRRCWRYMQEFPVNAHFVCAETERSIFDVLSRKQHEHEEMKHNMYASLSSIQQMREDKHLTETFDHKIVEEPGYYRVHNGDCIELTPTVPENSVDFTIYSPPFSSLYIYSESLRDMGNCDSDEEFFNHYKFLIPEILRITRPGRLCAVHCKQLVYYRNQKGSAGLRDFRGEIIKAHVEAGWDYHSEVCIWKDPVIEMQRTKAHGLLHRQVCRDSTFSRTGLAEYLILFRKWAKEEKENEQVRPVNIEDDDKRFIYYIGGSGPSTLQPDDPRGYSIEVWQRYASPVWFDIRQTNVLNTVEARNDKDEKHICPLQLDVIERALHLWTNPGDTVFSPFMGIGSEGYCSLKAGRKFVGIELKEEYFRQAIKHLNSQIKQYSLFDALSSNTG